MIYCEMESSQKPVSCSDMTVLRQMNPDRELFRHLNVLHGLLLGLSLRDGRRTLFTPPAGGLRRNRERGRSLIISHDAFALSSGDNFFLAGGPEE